VRERPLLLLLTASGLLGACSSKPETRPSPLPYGYAYRQGTAPKDPRPPPAASGEQLDAAIAIVGDDVLTRRRLIRETGGRVADESDAAFERGLKKRMLNWAAERVFVQAAERIGIKLPEASLDEYVKEQSDKLVKRAREDTGQPVTLADVLAERHISYEEFRESWRSKLYVMLYLRKLMVGIGGTRPEVDMEVSPAEVRRVYRANPGLFDQQAGARFSLWQLQVKTYLVGDRSFIDAEQEATRQAEALGQAFKAGASPAEVARRFAVPPEDWRENEQFVEQDSFRERFRDDQTTAWLFAPERRARDTLGIALPHGPLVVGVLEVRPPRRRSFEEVYDDVVARMKRGRELRVEKEELIRLVRQGAVAWPEELADALAMDAQETLGLLERDPAMAGARFR
jgi:hypothetical protein